MPGSEIRGCARSQSLYGAQLRQEAEEAAARHVPAPCAPRLRKQRLGPQVRSRSMRRQTCQAFPGDAVPSGAAEAHAVSAAPLSAAEAGEQPPLGSAIQRQQAPPLWLRACASGPGLLSLPCVPKQSPKQSSAIGSGRLPAQPRENLVRARGGLFHHQVERLFLYVWSCTIILSPSALFCRLFVLWELMPLVIRSGLLP
jgi:hypothetical protein